MIFRVALFGLLCAASFAAPEPCSKDVVAECAENVFFYAIKPHASTDKKDVKEDCKKEEDAIECATRFEKAGCINGGILKGMFQLIFEGATSEHKLKCEEGGEKNKAYYKYVPCINQVGDKLGDCMRNMTSVLEASAAQAPLNNRVPYTCCSLREYRECIVRTIGTKCNKAHVEYGRGIIDGIAGDFLDTICTPYKKPQCSKLPKLKLKPAKATTLVPAVLENLHALG